MRLARVNFSGLHAVSKLVRVMMLTRVYYDYGSRSKSYPQLPPLRVVILGRAQAFRPPVLPVGVMILGRGWPKRF